MHRTKTRFAARINHVATALEKRGVRATYSLHDRVLANRSSRRHFSGSAPELDEVQQRIVSALDDETGRQIGSEKLLEIVFDGTRPVRAGDQFGIGGKR